MRTESQIRQQGLDKDNFESAFLWEELEPDFIRQLVEHDITYKHILQHWLLMAVHGYAVYASNFYMNMYKYLKLGLAEQKQLKYYVDQIYSMYRERVEEEYNSRHTYSLVDESGKVLDQFVC